MQKELNLRGKKSSQKRGNSSQLLGECKKCLVLRKFEESIVIACDALLDSSSIQSSKDNSFDSCLLRLGSLTQDQFHQKFDGTPFIVILIQSLFGLDFQMEKQGKEVHYYQTVLQFLSNFYGRVDRFPFDVLFLCVNLLVIGKHYREAKSMLHYSLEIETSSSPIQSSFSKTIFNADETEKLIQVYIFHVLPNLDQIPEGLAYLETPVDIDFDNQSDVKNPLGLLPKWKRDALKEQLNKLLDELNENKKKEGSESVNNENREEVKKSSPLEQTTNRPTPVKLEPNHWKSLITFWVNHRSKILLIVSILTMIGVISKLKSKPSSQPKRFQGRIQPPSVESQLFDTQQQFYDIMDETS